MDARLLDMLGQIAKGIAAQFGPNCEVVVHEISDKSAYSSIVAIENGHVSGRKVGDGRRTWCSSRSDTTTTR